VLVNFSCRYYSAIGTYQTIEITSTKQNMSEKTTEVVGLGMDKIDNELIEKLYLENTAVVCQELCKTAESG
jgi:hypothetical protein